MQGAGGRSVLAYPSEIDAWLNGPGHEVEAASEIAAPLSRSISSSGHWQLAAALALVSVVVAAVVWRFRTPTLRAEELRIDVTRDAVVAFDTAGVERWRHVFGLRAATSADASCRAGDLPDSETRAGTIPASRLLLYEGCEGGTGRHRRRVQQGGAEGTRCGRLSRTHPTRLSPNGGAKSRAGRRA